MKFAATGEIVGATPAVASRPTGKAVQMLYNRRSMGYPVGRNQ